MEKSRDYFFGYYYKCQSDTQTIALIAATHGTGADRSCSIQVITEKGAWAAEFPYADYFHQGSLIRIGKNVFNRNGLRVDIDSGDLCIRGELAFGPLTGLRYDIMGPFALVPRMECRHMVGSMRHTVDGVLTLNGEEYRFVHGKGYWEGDQGRSFPKRYLWTHTFLPEGGSLMLSVADIPLGGISFTGIIGVVLWKGREYRLATYLGARAAEIQNGGAWIRQGNKSLKARLIESSAKKGLRAPVKGSMVRTIHESTECRAEYEFRIGDHLLFHLVTDKATFEYEYQTESAP